ncbi:MAG TPA: DoxX family protein [Polyangium sp.]|nr:DoxX family protein [Polyangium sp.]
MKTAHELTGRHEASIRPTWVSWFSTMDQALKKGMARSGIPLARIALGIVFFWFGVLKFFPGLSPAQDLAGRTISVLTFGLVDPALSLPILALWECAIGIGFLSGKYLRFTILLLFLQMAGTMLPILFFPHETFTLFPISPTLEGQYIIKNLVLVSVGLILGATVDGDVLLVKPAATNPPES